jgi:hypothetical protein
MRVIESGSLLDSAGRQRCCRHTPRTAAERQRIQYPPDPPTVEDIIAVVRAAGETPGGVRLRGLVVVLWRASSK